MATYLSFLVLAVAITLLPGPDTALILRSALTRGRGDGLSTMAGVSLAGAIQGLLAAGGLGAIILASEPLFRTVTWVGAAYLMWLGLTSLRLARRGFDGSDTHPDPAGPHPRGLYRRSFGQGFLCNITNPKVLAFNLAVLPQFVGTGPPARRWPCTH